MMSGSSIQRQVDQSQLGSPSATSLVARLNSSQVIFWSELVSMISNNSRPSSCIRSIASVNSPLVTSPSLLLSYTVNFEGKAGSSLSSRNDLLTNLQGFLHLIRQYLWTEQPLIRQFRYGKQTLRHLSRHIRRLLLPRLPSALHTSAMNSITRNTNLIAAAIS